MRFLVTGALGHIGSKLIRELAVLYSGSEIIMIDNMYAQRYCSLYNLPKSSKYNFILADTSNYNLDLIVKKCDVAIHLAAITNATESFEIADQLDKNNFESTKNVAHSCLLHNIPMIHISSTSVYGKSNSIVSEYSDNKDINPQSPYAKTKIKEEKFLSSLEQKGLRFITLRFGTIFGISKGMRFHTAVNKFCFQASINQPLTVWKTAYNQLRPYLDLKDAIQAISIVLNNEIYNCKIYNVLTDNYTVKDIIDEIKKHIKNLKIDYVESKIMNQYSYEVSNSRIKKFGFIPKGNMAEGIEETLKLISLD